MIRSNDYPSPVVNGFPSLDGLAADYSLLRTPARGHLDGPVSARIRCRQDGEDELETCHGSGPWRPDGDWLREALLTASSRP